MTDRTSLTNDPRPGSSRKQPRWGYVMVGIVVLAILLWWMLRDPEQNVEDDMKSPSGTGMIMEDETMDLELARV